MDVKLVFESLKSLVNVIADVKQRETIIEAQTLILELQAQLLESQKTALGQYEKSSALVRENQSLREEIAKMREDACERQRYELLALTPGVFAYALKPSARGAEPQHFLCQKCLDKGVKAILQDLNATFNGSQREFVTLACPECGMNVLVPRRDFAQHFEKLSHSKV